MASSSGISSKLGGGHLDDFIAYAPNVINIKLIRSENDFDSEKTAFHPEYTHQIFGENENIFGYQGLQVRLYYTAARLVSYLGFDYEEKISRETTGLDPDNVLKTISDKLEGQFHYNLDEFTKELAKENNFKPCGELIDSFTINDSTGEGDSGSVRSRRFDIFRVDFSFPGFRAYHERMQTFLLWFIDAASYIDVDDDRWECFVVYEKCSNDQSVQNGHSENSIATSSGNYYFVGYTSVYRYYAYPERMRPRISQSVVLPPFQKKGIGARMVQAIYNAYSSPAILDITVEDPSDNFVRLRDYVDAFNCMKLASFQAEVLKKGWSEEMAQESQEKLKMSRKQARRIYEILRLRATNLSDGDEYKAYRLDVKNRLNAPFQKQKSDQEKLQKSGALSEAELKQRICCQKKPDWNSCTINTKSWKKSIDT